MRTPGQVAVESFAALAAGDLAGVTALMVEDVTLEHPGGVVRGRAAAAEHLGSLAGAHAVRLAVEDDSATVEWSSRRGDARGVDVLTVRNGFEVARRSSHDPAAPGGGFRRLAREVLASLPETARRRAGGPFARGAGRGRR